MQLSTMSHTKKQINKDFKRNLTKNEYKIL